MYLFDLDLDISFIFIYTENLGKHQIVNNQPGFLMYSPTMSELNFLQNYKWALNAQNVAHNVGQESAAFQSLCM